MRVGPALGVGIFLIGACGGSSAPPASAPHVAKKSAPAGLSQVEGLCARIASCAKPYDPAYVRDPTECVDHLLLHGSEDESTRCLVKAQTCKDVSQCLHGDSDAVAATFCNAHPGVLSACDGSHFITCIDPADESTVIDCAKFGANCAENKLEGGLVVRGCSSQTLCPVGAPESRCTSDHEVVSCRDGIVDKMNCATGEHCVMHRDGDEQVAACAVTNEKRCTDVGDSACDGNALVECVSDGHYGRVRTTDCAAHGLSCNTQGRSAACVASDPVECAPFPAKCDGGFLVYCAEGVVARVACAEIGLGVCDPSAHGPEAACRPRP